MPLLFVVNSIIIAKMSDSLAQAKYAALTFNSPLSQPHADQLLALLGVTVDTSVVDLGCGWGELLIQASIRGGEATGIDTDETLLARGRQGAKQRSAGVAFVNRPAADWQGQADRAICIGASHAFGGTRQMLKRLAEIVPRGRVLVGDGCWEAQPTEAAVQAMGDDVPTLAHMVKLCRETGWQVLHLNVSDEREWDDFESGHRAGVRSWLLENKDSPLAAEAEQTQNERETGYLTCYRGVFGFVWLILAR